MAVISLLVAVAIPAISNARLAAQKTTCLNHLRNVGFGLTQYEHFNRRLPASGNYWLDGNQNSERHMSWAVLILPHIDQGNLYAQLDLDRPLSDPVNQILNRSQVSLYRCPLDVSSLGIRDLSYAVNGGVGFTTRLPGNGVRDCPVTPDWTPYDLNGDGAACRGDIRDAEDRKNFKRLGLFFLETWNAEITKRHHGLADVIDGTSQTFLVGENVRTGSRPEDASIGFADPTPFQSSFFIGNPCLHASCRAGAVNYAQSNRGPFRINSGLQNAEGTSPVPNSFHPGGVHMTYADGHVNFLSEQIDGDVYAALASPQGLLLDGSPLAQKIVSGEAP